MSEIQASVEVLIGQLAISPAKGLDISLNTILGNEGNAELLGNNSDGYFGVLDFVVNYQVSSKFYLGGWYMIGSSRGGFQGNNIGTTKK